MGAAAALYLILRLVRQRFGGPVAGPPKGQKIKIAQPVSKVLGKQAVFIAGVVGGMLLVATNFFKSTDEQALGRVLSYLSFYGTLLMGAFIVTVLIATLLRRPTSGPPEEPDDRA